MAKIQIEVTDDLGVKTISKISGVPASAGLDSLNQFMATQTDTVDGVSVPKYDGAADFVKKTVIRILQDIAPKFPSAQTKADVDDISAKIAALEAKRKSLFDAALAEK